MGVCLPRGNEDAFFFRRRTDFRSGQYLGGPGETTAMSGKYRPTRGVFTICTGTYGSGARTGSGLTRPAQCVILSVQRTAPTASIAVVPGYSSADYARSALRLDGASPPTATTTWASASVSDRPASSGVSLREPPSRGGACAGSDRNRTERRFFFPNPSSLSAVANAWVSPANQDLPQYSGRTRQPYGKETECSYMKVP